MGVSPRHVVRLLVIVPVVVSSVKLVNKPPNLFSRTPIGTATTFKKCYPDPGFVGRLLAPMCADGSMNSSCASPPRVYPTSGQVHFSVVPLLITGERHLGMMRNTFPSWDTYLLDNRTVALLAGVNLEALLRMANAIELTSCVDADGVQMRSGECTLWRTRLGHWVFLCPTKVFVPSAYGLGGSLARASQARLTTWRKCHPRHTGEYIRKNADQDKLE